MATFNYDLPNGNAKVWPMIGMGTGLLWKVDHNLDFSQTHYSLAYGFHINGGLKIQLKNRMLLTFDLMYNLIIPPVSEDVGTSGVIVTTGIRLPVKNGEMVK